MIVNIINDAATVT